MLKTITAVSFMIACVLARSPSAFNGEAWRKRSVYQVLTDRFARSDEDSNLFECTNLLEYCGGSWKGLENHLSYIKDMGFDAIWISPIVKNYGKGYHGYWAQHFEEVNEKFGSEEDLKSLVESAHKMDILVMVDVVANHIGYVPTDKKTKIEDFSGVWPFHDESYYHDNCQITDWENQWQLENCRLCGLPDLKQELPFVRDYLIKWIRNLVRKYDFDGIRIDTLGHVAKEFWLDFSEASGVFSMGEIFKMEIEKVAPYQDFVSAVFDFPLQGKMRKTFGKEKESLEEIGKYLSFERFNYRDQDTLGVFVDNHDMSRFLSVHGNVENFKSAMILSLTAPGIPFVYMGSELAYNGGDDPKNRESLWQDLSKREEPVQKMIRQLNELRKTTQIWDHRLEVVKSDQSLLAFVRGQVLVVLTNSDAHVEAKITGLQDKYANGQELCNLFDRSDCIFVLHGIVIATLTNSVSKVYIPSNSVLFGNIQSSTLLTSQQRVVLIGFGVYLIVQKFFWTRLVSLGRNQLYESKNCKSKSD